MITPKRKVLDSVYVFHEGMIVDGYIHKIVLKDEVTREANNSCVNSTIDYLLYVNTTNQRNIAYKAIEAEMFDTKEEAANSWLNKQGLQCGIEKGKRNGNQK